MVKKRLKSITAAVLVVAMLVTMAPQVVCEAAETAWKIVKNQETPLDEVYFDCKKSDDATKSYLYGYKDGKVAIMDSDYNLVKKTDYDEIAAMKKKVNGVTAYIVSKKVGKEKIYGIISETGETIIEPKYIDIWSGDNAIQVKEKVNGEKLVGLLSYADLKQIVPCGYNYIDGIIKKDENLLIGAYYNGNYTVILNGKSIFSVEQEEGYYVNFEFGEYENKKSILVFYINENNDRISKASYISYDGKILKEMSAKEYDEEYKKTYDNIKSKRKQAYNDACDKWLNSACQDGKKHVEEFYKSNRIAISDIQAKTYYQEVGNGEKVYYWVIVTAKYSYDRGDDEGENENIVYVYIYNEGGKNLLSGRSFVNIAKDNKEDNPYIFTYYQKEDKSNYILTDSGVLQYLDQKDDKITNIFQVNDSDELAYMCQYTSAEHKYYSDISHHKIVHCIHYDCGNIEETGCKDEKIFIYADKKVYNYDYTKDGYYFIEDKAKVKICRCELEEQQTTKDDMLWNQERYKGKILWKDYGEVNIGLDQLKKASIVKVDNGILIRNDVDKNIYFINKSKQYIYSYVKLGMSEADKNISLKNVCSCNNWIYFILNGTESERYYCLNTEDGSISNVLFDDNNKYSVYQSDTMSELGGKLYLYSSSGKNIVSIDKKTFETTVSILNINGSKEKVDSLFILDGKVYVQYVYNKDDKNYYGIMDLSGKRYIDSSDKKFKAYAGYITFDDESEGGLERDLYDSSMNLVSKFASADSIYDSNKKDENGYNQKINGLYELSYYTKADTRTLVKSYIVDNNISKIICEVNNKAYFRKFTHIDNYYIMSIYNSNSKTTQRVIIDSSTGEQLYSGDGYVYIDDLNKKFVVIDKRKNSPTSVPTGSATTVPTQTPTVKPTEAAVPTPTSTVKPIPTETPVVTPIPTKTPIQIPDWNGNINVPQPTLTVKPTETPASTVKPTDAPVATAKPTPVPTMKPTETPVSTQKPTASPVTISVAKKSVKVKTGKTTKISYSAYNAKGKKVKVKAVSSNTKAAKVSVLSTSQLEITVPDNAKDGAVSKITLTNGKKKTTIKVTVKAVSNKVNKLKAESKKVSVKKGDKLSVTYDYSAQNDKKQLTEDVGIKSSDKAIVKITGKKISNGKITVKIKAVNKGKVDITVKIGSKSATTKVTVK